jgi:dTMP kinase
MAGRLAVIEGTDASGKSTQFALLSDRLEREKTDFRHIVFPRYSEPSSALVRMYLGGEFGQNPGDVNPFAASTFFAVDRYASYKKDWQAYYASGGLVLADRYTTSNAVHQGAKLTDGERRTFFEWLFDFEYRKIGLPQPDLVVLLDMPPECARRLLKSRSGAGDIHERDFDYLSRCRDAALLAASLYSWKVVDCAPGGTLRSVEDIGGEIYSLINKLR